MHSYKYPHPSVTVDCVVFGLDEGVLKLLLIKRLLAPFKDKWALPGGFVLMDEDLETAALRELKEETGVDDLYLEQFQAYGKPNRDPRERVITIAYFAIVNLFKYTLKASTDAKEAEWYPVNDLPSLAFDHENIVLNALSKLQNKVLREPLVFEFIPEKFTLPQVQFVYETILQKKLDKRNFRKKLLATGLIEVLEEHETNVTHRAARFHLFNKDEWNKKSRGGLEFRI